MFLKENSSRLQSISQKSKSNVIIISQSRRTTLQQMNNLINHGVVYNHKSFHIKQNNDSGKVLSAVKFNHIFHTIDSFNKKNVHK